MAMAKNLETAEKITFAAWATATRDNQEAQRERRRDEAGNPVVPHGQVEITMLMRAWHDNVAKRKQLERELPEIMLKRGRYVDVNVVSSVLERCVASMGQDLDQVGISVAARCVGKPARKIRELVDEAVARARRHVSEVWKAIGAEP